MPASGAGKVSTNLLDDRTYHRVFRALGVGVFPPISFFDPFRDDWGVLAQLSWGSHALSLFPDPQQETIVARTRRTRERDPIPLVANIQIDDYLDRLAPDPYILELGAYEVYLRNIPLLRVVQRNLCDQAVCGQDVEHIHAFHHRRDQRGKRSRFAGSAGNLRVRRFE